MIISAAVVTALLLAGTGLLVTGDNHRRALRQRISTYVHAGPLAPEVDPPRSISRTAGVRKLLDALSSDRSVSARLARSASPQSLEAFRVDQLRWATFGMLAATGLGIVRTLAGLPLSPGTWLLLVLLAAVAGVLLRDYALTRKAKGRVAAISSELPAFAELLAFTVAAGLPPASALKRVAARIGGALSEELTTCSDHIAAGAPLAGALTDMADRIGSTDIQRFVDGIVVATHRGTPLAEVLRAQALDARSAGHRRLMEQAGKREILALIPVVFLILPVVVIVAVYPGFINLVV